MVFISLLALLLLDRWRRKNKIEQTNDMRMKVSDVCNGNHPSVKHKSSSARNKVKMNSRNEKDKAKQLQDKCQSVLTALLRDEDNKYCVDCDSKGNIG